MASLANNPPIHPSKHCAAPWEQLTGLPTGHGDLLLTMCYGKLFGILFGNKNGEEM